MKFRLYYEKDSNKAVLEYKQGVLKHNNININCKSSRTVFQEQYPVMSIEGECNEITITEKEVNIY